MLAVLRVCSIAAVEENDKAAVGRSRGGSGEVVDGARAAGNFAEQAPVRKRGRCLRVGWQELKKETASEGLDEPKPQIGHARNCSGSVSKGGKCDLAIAEHKGAKSEARAGQTMRKKKKLEKGTEARRRARAAGVTPAGTRVIEDKRKKPEKHKRRWLEQESA